MAQNGNQNSRKIRDTKPRQRRGPEIPGPASDNKRIPGKIGDRK